MIEEELFHRAREKPTLAEQLAFLDEACADQPELRERVERLLRSHRHEDSFLQAPVTVDESIAEGPGTVIGPYKLVEQIGEGGMGTVWMTQQTEPVKRLVALKLIKAGMDSRQVITRFEAERQALALMDHPNIARVLDGGTTSAGRPYFVMDLVKGVPITKYCDEHHLTPRQRLELFIPVCHAVQHAHQKGIIHRDLKPSNVVVALYDGKPVPKVIDFGVAKATGQTLTDKTLVTGFGAIIGTLEYMSPEQAKVNQLDIDTRSDIYSLGVLLYELLTGSPPFSRKDLEKTGMLEMLRVIREEEPSKPSTKLSTAEGLPTLAANRGTEPAKLTKMVRGELDWIVMKALEKDRNRRYETANSLAMDLQRYLADEPVQACPPSAWYRFRKLVRRKKTAFVIAACVFMALAGIAGAIGWAVRDKGAREEGIERERLAREEALDQAVETTLNETGPLMEQGKWPEALDAVERADRLLAAAGRTERPPRLLELKNDLILAERLESIYRGPTWRPRVRFVGSSEYGTEYTFQAQPESSEEEFFWGRQQDGEFAKAFQDFGIDIDLLGPAEAAAQIDQRSIRLALVKALDEWAPLRQRARGDNDAGSKKLIEIARQADQDPWRNRCRDALLRHDREALEELADAVPIRQMPPASLCLLGHTLKGVGALDKAMDLLTRAQHEYPDDVWINDALAFFSWSACQPPRYDDALRFYTAVLALRPRFARTHMSLADALRAKGALDDALAEYSRAIELEPKAGWAWGSRGNYHRQLRQYDKALDDLSKAIELQPKEVVGWIWRGIAHRELHEYENALADCSKAIDLDPKNAWSWYERAIYYRERHQHEKALADFSKALELYPKYLAAWIWRGVTFRELRQYDKALDDFSKAIELDPRNAWSRENLAIAYMEMRRHDKAIAEFSKIIELEPKVVSVWIRRGTIYGELHEYDKALADFSKAIEVGPNSAWALHARGRFYCDKLRKYDKGIADFTKAIKVDPKDREAYLYRAENYMALGQKDKAVADWSKATEWEPANAWDWRLRGTAYKALGQYPKALADFSKAIELNPKDALAWTDRAMTFQFLHQDDKAIADLDRAAELADSAMAWNNLAWLLATCPDAKFRDVANAVGIAKKAVAMAPKDGAIWNTLGVAQYRAGTCKEAIAALEKSRELRNGGDSFDWFFLAMAHWQLGDKEQGRKWFDEAVQWMEKNQPKNEELARFRAEAGELLGINHKDTKRKSPD
jgi:tetratricopeptide (TPR) repeat protein